MARTRRWSRDIRALSIGSAGTSADLVFTLQPGDTLQRAIVSLDYWIDSTTVEYLDAGATLAWGLDLGTSNVSATRYPLADFMDTTTRWVYIDQMILDVVNAQNVAGTISYIARSSERNRYTDTDAQFRNDLTVPLYGWLTTQVPSGIYSNASLFGSAATSALILNHA